MVLRPAFPTDVCASVCKTPAVAQTRFHDTVINHSPIRRVGRRHACYVPVDAFVQVMILEVADHPCAQLRTSTVSRSCCLLRLLLAIMALPLCILLDPAFPQCDCLLMLLFFDCTSRGWCFARSKCRAMLVRSDSIH